MARKFTIRLHDNGNVSYYYWRDTPLQHYLIEWPYKQLILIDEDKLQIEGYKKHILPGDHLRLSWSTPKIYELTYRKIAKIKELKYEEEFRTKQDSERSGYWLSVELDDPLIIDRQRSSVEWNGSYSFDQESHIQVFEHSGLRPNMNNTPIGSLSISDHGFEFYGFRDHNLILRLFLCRS